MASITLDAYIFFGGNCREGMEFYQSVFGGELDLRTYADMPDSKPEHADQIMHAHLTGGVIHLMGSDGVMGEVSRGSKIELTLSGDDEVKLREIFGKLSAGGKVKYPLEKQFWGDTFGSLTDRFSIDWQINISNAAA